MDQIKNSEKCFACGSENILNIGNPIYSNSNSKYSVMQCSECNLQWSNPMPTKQDMDEHYGKYYEVRYNTVDKYPVKNYIRNKLTFRKLRLKNFFSLINKNSPVKSIIDFGCGEADILYFAKKEGWKILGVDYSDELVEKFRNDDIDFKQGSDLDNLGLEQDCYGCIVSKHTLEHLTNLQSFFVSARKILSKDGIIAIKTPSSSSLRARLNLADWHFVRPPEHCWGFNANNFGKIVERNGFEIIYLKDSSLVDELTCIAKKK